MILFLIIGLIAVFRLGVTVFESGNTDAGWFWLMSIWTDSTCIGSNSMTVPELPDRLIFGWSSSTGLFEHTGSALMVGLSLEWNNI